MFFLNTLIKNRLIIGESQKVCTGENIVLANPIESALLEILCDFIVHISQNLKAAELSLKFP